MSGGGQGPAMRYNLKKRLISRKPTLNKKQLQVLLDRSCAEVLDEEMDATSAADRRQRLYDCVVRMIEQEPRTEKLVVRLVRTRQGDSAADPDDPDDPDSGPASGSDGD